MVRPAVCAVGSPPIVFVAGCVSLARTVRGSAPDDGSGWAGSAIGFAASQLWGTDNFPSGAALPTLASTGPRTPAEPRALAPVVAALAALAAFAAAKAVVEMPVLCILDAKPPADVDVRPKLEATVNGFSRVLRFLTIVSSDVVADEDPVDEEDPDDVELLEDPPVARACSCWDTADVVWDTVA